MHGFYPLQASRTQATCTTGTFLGARGLVPTCNRVRQHHGKMQSAKREPNHPNQTELFKRNICQSFYPQPLSCAYGITWYVDSVSPKGSSECFHPKKTCATPKRPTTASPEHTDSSDLPPLNTLLHFPFSTGSFSPPKHPLHCCVHGKCASSSRLPFPSC